MTLRLAVAVAALAAAATAGCGFGPGPDSRGTATLTVTRDYGADAMDSTSETDPSDSETVLRLLDRSADITTRYGGGFVQSIDGLAGRTDGTRRSDWFFYVNGVESPIGATGVRVRGGDRIWWDYRDWTDSMRVPAVVGSYPQPLAGASGAVSVDCAGAPPPCDEVAGELRDSGVRATVKSGLGRSGGEPRVLVGAWPRLKADPAARLLGGTPAEGSGVFASFDRSGGLQELDVEARPVRTLRSGGLVAAVRLGDDAPTWLVTGTDPGGVADAAAQFNAGALGNRYAIAVSGSRPMPLPVQTPGGGG